MKVKDPFQCILSIANSENKQSLLVKYVPTLVQLSDQELKDLLISNTKDITIEDKVLIVYVIPAKPSLSKVNSDFSFTELEIRSLHGHENKTITINDIRKIIHNLSVAFSGKTFTEIDFDNAVIEQVRIDKNSNLTVDERYTDAQTAILYLFLSGFLQHIFESTENVL